MLNGTKKIVDLNGNGGAYIAVLATGPVRRVVIKESNLKQDGVTAVVAQGLTYSLPDDNFTQVYGLPAPSNNNDPPMIELPDRDDASFHESKGVCIGNGPSVNIGQGVGPATTLIKLRSLTATPTSVEVTQIY